MEISTAPLEGIVVIVMDGAEDAGRIEKTLSHYGAAVFVAHDRDGLVATLEKVTPHFAVIDPTAANGTAPDSVARMFFEHESCRLILYSANLPALPGARPNWLIDKNESVAVVADAILDAVRDPMWVRKGGDDVKPRC